MKNVKFLVVLFMALCFCGKAFAQYSGGRGDGFAMAETSPSAFGIKQISYENSMHLLPNPVITGQNANLQFDKPLNANTALIITDLTGRIFRNETIAAGANEYTINTSGMPPGIYIIKIVSSEYQAEKKLTIL